MRRIWSDAEAGAGAGMEEGAGAGSGVGVALGLGGGGSDIVRGNGGKGGAVGRCRASRSDDDQTSMDGQRGR